VATNSWHRIASSVAMVAAMACSPADAIVGGTATTAFGQVGTGTSASAVQITPNWVLTARHVAFAVGDLFSDAYGSSLVDAVYPFSSAAFPENDLKLVRLAAAIGAPELPLVADVIPYGVLATPVAATIASARNQSPRGYGFTEIREVDQLAQVTNGPLVVANYLMTLSAASDGTPYVQGGDSGGALFLGHVTDSSSPLVGIASAVDNVAIPPESYFVELSRYRSWIDQTMAADVADTQTALWVVTGVPEASTWALWLVGLASLAAVTARRRRH
jgi:MYXO-CTERM domain-containing protein